LPLRMERHVENALGVARFLQQHPMVETVRYAGLPNSPYRPLVDRYLPRGAGAVFAFDLRGDRQAGQRFIESLRLWSHLANVGDAKSLVIHPASTTHRQLSEDELVAAGISGGTIRLSVGLETLDDLVWDLERGLSAASSAPAESNSVAEVVA
jgi:O-acetylhomoserine (thiol)-lyase